MFFFQQSASQEINRSCLYAVLVTLGEEHVQQNTIDMADEEILTGIVQKLPEVL